MKTPYRLQLLLLLFNILNTDLFAQSYTAQSVFAHNDYVKLNAFYESYGYGVGYIEADIFFRDNELLVAHSRQEIKNERTLRNLYLTPLQNEIDKNNGWAYPDTTMHLTLMIDLKTEGTSTLKELVRQLKEFPGLLSCKGLDIAVSGNVPPPDTWDQFPAFIKFDGRPGIQYNELQLARVLLISTSFWDHSKWDGSVELPEIDKQKMTNLIGSVHALGKKIRFWAAPDFESGWTTLMNLDVDVIGTDRVPDLVSFLSIRK